MTDGGASKGFGFVCFSEPNSAKDAIEENNGKAVGDKCLYVSVAQPAEERRNLLESQFSAGVTASISDVKKSAVCTHLFFVRVCGLF